MAITGNDLLKKLRGETNEDEKEKEKSSRKLSGEDLLNRRKVIQTTDTSGVDQKYINSFFTDANTFLTTAEKDYGGLGWGNATSSYDSRNTSWQDLNTRADTISAWLYKNRNDLDSKAYDSLNKSLEDIRGGGASVLDSFKSAVDYYSQWATEDEYNKWYEDYKAKQEMANSEQGKQGWGQYLADQDALTEAAKASMDEEEWWEKIGRWLGNGGTVDTTLPTANATIAMNALRETGNGNSSPNGKWSEEEKNIFGYLYATDRSEAYKYAVNVNNQINKAKEEEALKKIAESATSGFWAGAGQTLGAIATTPLALADYLANLVEANALGTITSDGNVSPFEYSQAVTGGIAEHLNEKSGVLNENIPIIGGKGVGDIYGLGTSIAQSLASGYAFGPGGTLIAYFGQGAASGMDEALSRGASEDQAALYGTALGVFEGLAEMVGIDNLFKLGSTTTLKGFIKNILNQAGAEGMEEGLTSLLSNIADNVIMQNKSNFYALVEQYKAQGMSESEAKTKAWWDSVEGIAFDTIAGAASGGVSGGIHTTAQTIGSNIDAKNIYGINDGIDLINEALGINPDNAYAQKMKHRLDDGKNVSGYQLNRLVEQNESALVSQDKEKIKSGAETRFSELGEKGDIGKLSDIIAKKNSGEKLTKAEKTALEESTYGQRVANESDPNNIESGRYSSSWAEKLGTERINEKAYNKALRDSDEGTNIPFKKKTPLAVIEPPEEKESEYKVAEDGKTKLGDTEIAIKEIASIKDGEVILRLEDGSTVNASDVTFGSNDEALIYESVAKMDVPLSTANAFVKGFRASDGVSAQIYAMDIPLAYQYGKIGYQKGLEKLNLTSEQRNTAYVLGRDDVKASGRTWSDTSRKTPETNRAKASKDGIIYDGFELNEDSLTDIQKASLAGIRTLAKMSPTLEIHITQSVVENGKKYVIVNGKKQLAKNGVFRNGNEIYIDLNAGKGATGTMLYTASHEVVHFIAENSFEDFQALADFLFEHYGENNVPVDSLIKREIDKLKKGYESEGKELPNEEALYMKAYEEVVANAMSKMFADPTSYEKLAKLKSENLTLWEKIGEAIKHILDKLKSILGIYEGYTPDAMAAHYVDDFSIEVYNKLQDLYLKGFVNAEKNYQASIGSRNLEDFADAKNTEGESLFQYKAMEADEDTYREMLKKWGKMTDSQISNLFLTIDNAMELIKDNLEALDYAWEADIDDRAFSPVKPNSDKLYQVSLDYSTLCRKRILQQTIIAHLQEALNKPLTREEGIAIRDALIALQEEGRQIEVACALCYVESARMKSPEQIKRFIDNREAVIKEFFAGKSGGDIKANIKKAEDDTRERLHKENPNGIKGKDGKTMLDPRTAKLNQLPKKYADEIRSAKKAAKQAYTPTAEEQRIIEVAKGMTVSDFTSPEGLENLAKNYPSLFDAYTSYVRNATKSKGIENDTWWRAGDSMQIGDVLIANMNRENGLRSQSWSDFQVIHILDYIASTIELATRETKEQAYTKVPDYAELMGNTGVMINLSLIPTAKFNGTLDYDSVEGIDYKRALELRDKYHATVGTICIGVDNVQIKMLLGDATIDYVIPYHKSGMSAAIRKLMHIPTWSQYEEYQSEKNLSRADAEKQAKKYGVTLLAESDPNYHKGTSFSEWFDIREAQQIAKMENANPSDKAKQKKYGVMYGGYMAMQNAANNYLKLCAERGVSPKFSHEKADFTAEENYWKLLIDRKMVDNITGEVIEQQTIKPIFDENEVMRILNDELERYPKVKADQDYAIRKVTEGMLSGKIKGGMSAKDIAKVMQTPVDNVTKTNIMASVEGDELYSVDDDFYTEYDAWDKRDTNVTFTVGTTSDALKSIGMKDQNIILKSGTVLQKIKKHPEISFDTFKGIPELLEHPIVVQFSDAIDPKTKKPKYESRITVLGELYSNNGKPVLVSLELLPTNQKQTAILDFSVVVSAYEKNALQQYLNENSILYIEPNKKRTNKWLSLNRLQLPLGENQYGSVRIIAYVDGKVKVQNKKNLTPMELAFRKAGLVDDFGNLPEGSDEVHSAQDTDSVSNRSLLANALESVAQNDIERNKLKQYKDKIALIESEQAKLSEIRGKIKELSFAKGPRDTEAINKLRFQENQTANRINTYDRQLLNLESTTALKGVLQREKQLAYKKAEKEGKEALAAYREKAAKTQRELLTRYQESRKKGIEGRRKTEMRHKIKDVVNELNQYLTKGTKEKHVPIELQRAVAEALNAVNMDTVGAEERIAKLQAELRAAKTLEDMKAITKKIEHIEEMGGNLEAKLSRLKTAYDSIINSDDPLIANSHDDVISSSIDKVIEIVGDTPLRDMSLYQLEAVYDLYKMVLTTIRNTNKAFKAAKGEAISTIANGVISELMDKKRKTPYSVKGMDTLSEFDWNNLKPIYAFERIGSANFTKVFKEVRAGEDVWANDMSEAQAFREEQFKKHKYDSWDFKERHSFTSTSGINFELSLDQILSLYAFSKRDQAGDHLKYGGFVFDGLSEVKTKNKVGVTVTYQLKDATAYNLSEETLAEIIGKLTPEQKAFVDEMQDYLSTVMGEKGNEVSLALYDIKLFKEKHYFPLKSAPQYLAKAKEQAQGDVKIKNKGFTKETSPKAKNPIVLSSFMDVWAGHVNEMSMYHAFTLPLEDFYRVYNYHTSADEKMEMVSVGASLENAHGQAAVKYIDQLLKDLNGGAIGDPREAFGKGWMSKFKKASVIASMSVVVQQPTAIVRATALVDAKYFVGKPTKQKHKDAWAEVKKYAPVAVIKEMGYFDTGMGKGSVEWLKGEKTFMDKVDDATSRLPALADEVTWVAIWNAVKRETVHMYKHLTPNSDAFLQVVGERFTEVVTKTQVYDSTLARSANMRSKGGFMQMWTMFMAEPTTSINMLQDAFRKGNKKYIARALGAVYGSVVLNSALVSLIYAMRDDDDDETFLEKYLSRFTTEVLDGINPLTYVPFFKDIWSLLQGYDIERADMSLISDAIGSFQQLVKVLSKDTSDMDEDELAEHKKAITEAILGITDTISSLVGVPVKNIRRDINGVINFFKTIGEDLDGRETTAGSLGDNILEDVKDSVPVWGWFPDESNMDKIYDAIIKGDTAYVERLKSGYKSEDAYQSAIRSYVGKKYKKGEIDRSEALELITEHGGYDSTEAYWALKEWDFRIENGEDATYSKYTEFYEAVKTGKNLKSVIKEYTNHGVKAETLASQITSYYKPLYRGMSNSERARLKGYLLNAYELLGYDRNKKSKDIDKWLED